MTGNAVKQRIYWSNALANGTSDEAIEARLEPHLWGDVVFQSQSRDERRLTDKLPDEKAKKDKTGVSDLLDELEEKKE